MVQVQSAGFSSTPQSGAFVEHLLGQARISKAWQRSSRLLACLPVVKETILVQDYDSHDSGPGLVPLLQRAVIQTRSGRICVYRLGIANWRYLRIAHNPLRTSAIRHSRSLAL
jgi:hypothetical protein